MKLGITPLVAATFFFASAVVAQIVPDDGVDTLVERKIKKQILVHDLENRVREIDLAAPRVMARYRIAEWLWNDGKDDIGRAGEFAVEAIEDMYKNRVEIPPVYLTTLTAGLFALLDRNSPIVSKSLKEKYNITSTEEGAIQDSLLGQPGGERIAVDAAIRSLFVEGSPDPQLSLLLYRLQQRNSPELFRLLEAMVLAEEQYRGRLTPITLAIVSNYYSGTDVPVGISRRFAILVLNRSQAASQLAFENFEAWLDILNANMSLLSLRTPELVPDSLVVRSVLLSRISQQSRDARERNERINNSSDKLAALIEEAEKAKEPLIKYDLYRRAARLALDLDLFKRSADLAIQFGEVDVSMHPILLPKNEVGQMLDAVTDKAIKAGDDESAVYAVDRMSDNERRAAGFGQIAKYYVEKGDRDSARSMMNNAIRVAAYVESLSSRASIYFKLIPISHSIDPTSVFQINALAARSVNTIPSLNVEDKPGTANFQNHVNSLMAVSWNLIPMLTDYAKTDRNGAADLSGRIEKKEVKIFADFVLGAASLDDGIEQEPAPSGIAK